MEDLTITIGTPLTEQEVAALEEHAGFNVVWLVARFVVYGEAQPRGSKIAGVSKSGARFVRDSSQKSYPWMADVKRAAAIAMEGKPLEEGPLRLELDFFKPRPKGHFGSGRNASVLKPSAPPRPITAPDAGKLARGTTDAMQGIVYRNDAQIVEEEHRKFYGEPARCEIRISRL